MNNDKLMDFMGWCERTVNMDISQIEFVLPDGYFTDPNMELLFNWWRKHYQPLQEAANALDHLIAVKNHKDKYGKDESYEAVRAPAWERARTALNNYKESIAGMREASFNGVSFLVGDTVIKTPFEVVKDLGFIKADEPPTEYVTPGNCEDCGLWDGSLTKGLCLPCSEKYEDGRHES